MKNNQYNDESLNSLYFNTKLNESFDNSLKSNVLVSEDGNLEILLGREFEIQGIEIFQGKLIFRLKPLLH